MKKNKIMKNPINSSISNLIQNRKTTRCLIIVSLILIMLLAGCSGLNQETILPEDIIQKAVSVYEQPKSYYGEAILEIKDNKQTVEKLTMKEWADNSGNQILRRVEINSETEGETISTNNGKEVVVYMKESNTAIKMNLDANLEGISNDYKEQLMNQLSSIAKTHDLSYQGEKEVSGFQTYHLSAKPKQQNSIIGEIHYWIDQNSWFVIKSTSESANTTTEMIYSKLDFAPQLDSSLFVQKLPGDVNLKDIDSDSPLQEKTIDLQQAAEIAGRAILTLPEDSGYQLKNVTCLDLSGNDQFQHQEINQSYEKNGAEALLLTAIIPTGSQAAGEGGGEDELKLPGEKEVTLRGQQGSVIDDVIKCISWSEDGLNYSILIMDPTLSIEKGLELADSLTV